MARPSSLGQVKAEIKHSIELLTTVLKRNTDVAAEYRLLIESDGRLEELLAAVNRRNEEGASDSGNRYTS